MVKTIRKKIRWSRNLAYAVGLIVTDGNLSKDGRHISLRSSERVQLSTFKRCLGIKNQISETKHNGFSKRPSYIVQFSDVKLYNWLRKIGVEPAKTYTIGSIKIPATFFQDFLRGHLDGDGCIQTYLDVYNEYKNKIYNNRRIYTRFLSASKKHILWLYQSIKKYIQVRGAILFKKAATPNRVPMWEIKFSKYDSLKLFQWMYHKKRIPCLLRKRKIADALLKRVVNKKLIV